jgi:anthranilate phosphoribosyltransferase
MESFKSYLAKVATGASLTRDEARDAFDDLLSGEVTPAQGGAFLMALRVRGEALEEIVGAVTAMRGRMLQVNAPEKAVDIVGTGGDHKGSYNISTLASIIVASCGVPVAKHGNRAASSKSGTADVLSALGVMGLGEHEAEFGLSEATLQALRIEAEFHAERRQHIGCAGPG